MSTNHGIAAANYLEGSGRKVSQASLAGKFSNWLNVSMEGEGGFSCLSLRKNLVAFVHDRKRAGLVVSELDDSPGSESVTFASQFVKSAGVA